MDQSVTTELHPALAVADEALSDVYAHACADAVAEVYLARRAAQRVVRLNIQPTETE